MNDVLKTFGKFLLRNKPAILVGSGIAGYMLSGVLLVTGTKRAVRTLDEVNGSLKNNGDEPLSNVESVKLVWKDYAAPIALSALSTTAILLAQSENTRRQTVLLGLYSIAEKNLISYKEVVQETVGKKVAEKIRGEDYKKRMAEDEKKKENVIIFPSGKHLCYDTYTGRYFENDIETLRRIQNDINQNALTDLYVTMNDMYYEMGLSGIKDGDIIGWEAGRLLLEFRFSSMLTSDGRPCLVVDYRDSPIVLSFK